MGKGSGIAVGSEGTLVAADGDSALCSVATTRATIVASNSSVDLTVLQPLKAQASAANSASKIEARRAIMVYPSVLTPIRMTDYPSA